MTRGAAPERSDERQDHPTSQNDRLLDRLVSETRAERTRLERLSLRVAGIRTRRPIPRERLLDRFDRFLGGGDRFLGLIDRCAFLFKEERERAYAEANAEVDGATGQRTRPLPDLEEIGARVQRRLDEGDVIPAILFRERPHLAHLAPLAEAAIREAQRIRRQSQPRP